MSLSHDHTDRFRSARKSCGRSSRYSSSWCAVRSPSTASSRPSLQTPSTGCVLSSPPTAARLWSSVSGERHLVIYKFMRTAVHWVLLFGVSCCSCILPRNGRTRLFVNARQKFLYCRCTRYIRIITTRMALRATCIKAFFCFFLVELTRKVGYTRARGDEAERTGGGD